MRNAFQQPLFSPTIYFFLSDEEKEETKRGLQVPNKVQKLSTLSLSLSLSLTLSVSLCF